MGEKKDSGSKDADNFGAEFGTDQLAAQRRRNQAVPRSRSRAGDDRASGKEPAPLNFSPRQAAQRGSRILGYTRPGDDRAIGTSRGTIPTGGAIAPATLTATTLNTGQGAAATVPAVNPPSISIPEAERLLLAQQNLASPLTFEQEVQNLINSPGFDAGADLPPSVLDNLASDAERLLSVQDDDVMIFDEDDPSGDRFLNSNLPFVQPLTYQTKIYDENDPEGDLFLNPSLGKPVGNIGTVPTTTDIVNASIEQARANQGSGIASLPTGITGDPVTDANIAGFRDTVTSLPVSATTFAELDAEDADPGTTVAQELDAEDAALAVSPSPLPRPVQPNFITRGLSALSDSLGQKALAGQIRDLQEFMEVPGAKFDYTTRQGVAPAGRGELRISPNGFVTYSGPKDASYTGPFANLVNPPERPEKDAGDPCPPGFQLIDGVCRPMFDIAGPATPPPAPGSNFQTAPTSGFPTSFAPMTQATPVSLPDPFVLSPTGAAIGRRV